MKETLKTHRTSVLLFVVEMFFATECQKRKNIFLYDSITA